MSDPAALAAVDEKEFNGNWDFPEWKQGFPSVFPAEMDPARCLCSSSGCEGTQNPPQVLRVAVFAARWAGLGREGSSGHSSWPPWELLPLLRDNSNQPGLGQGSVWKAGSVSTLSWHFRPLRGMWMLWCADLHLCFQGS